MRKKFCYRPSARTFRVDGSNVSINFHHSQWSALRVRGCACQKVFAIDTQAVLSRTVAGSMSLNAYPYDAYYQQYVSYYQPAAGSGEAGFSVGPATLTPPLPAEDAEAPPPPAPETPGDAAAVTSLPSTQVSIA